MMTLVQWEKKKKKRERKEREREREREEREGRNKEKKDGYTKRPYSTAPNQMTVIR